MIRHGKFNKFKHPISWNFVDIEGYQFAGTGDVRYQDFESLEIPGRYFPKLYYTLVKPLLINGVPVNKLKPPGIKALEEGEELQVHAVPLISNFDEGVSVQDDIEYRWDYVPNLYDVHNIVGTPPKKLTGWLVNQPDGAGYNIWYGIQANSFLVTTWSQGITPTLFPVLSSGIGIGTSITPYDNGYDFPPILFSVRGDPIRGLQYRPYPKESSNWWRGGCYQDVKSDTYDVSRRFIIYHDIDHKFYAFPTSARNSDLPEGESPKWGWLGFYKTAYPSWPSGVDASKIGAGNIFDINNFEYRPDWVFSHNGKYAVCIACLIDDPMSDGSFTREQYYNDGTYRGKSRESTPIVVEVEFLITITGKNPEDFNFTLITQRIIDPRDDGRAIVHAGYAVRDFPGYGIVADDLLILEYTMYMTDPDQRIGDLYRGPLGGEATLYISEHVLYHHPNVCTVAQIKNIGRDDAVDGTVLIEWMADYYGSMSSLSRLGLPDPFYDFSPTIMEWMEERADKHPSAFRTELLGGHCLYNTHIQSIDLTTLTVLITATLEMSGNILYNVLAGEYVGDSGQATVINDNQTIAGALQVLMVFGNEESKEYAGYAGLETSIKAMFNLTTTAPDISTYKKFDLRATVSGQPGSLTPYTESYNTSFGEYYRIAGDFSISNTKHEGTLFDSIALLYSQDMTFNYGGATQEINHVLGNVSCYTDIAYADYVDVPKGGGGFDRHYSLHGWNKVGFLDVACPGITEGDFVIYPKIFDLFDGSYFRTTLGMMHLKLGNMVNSLDASIVKGGSGAYSNYPFGKIYFNRTRNFTLHPLNELKKVIVHPNGSWSVCSSPIAAPTGRYDSYWKAVNYYPLVDGVYNYGFVESLVMSYHYGSGSGDVPHDQLYLDKIHYVYESNKNGKTVQFIKDTSHREMYNIAYDKDFTEQDFKYKLKFYGGEYYWLNETRTDDSGTFFNEIVSAPYFVGGYAIENECVNPTFSEAYQNCVPAGFIATTYDKASVFSESFLSEFWYEVLPLSSPATAAILCAEQRLYTSSGYAKHIHRMPTPKLEATWFVKNGFIDREENRG